MAVGKVGGEYESLYRTTGHVNSGRKHCRSLYSYLASPACASFPASWRYGLSKMAFACYVLPLSFGMTWFSGLFHQASITDPEQPRFLHGMIGEVLPSQWTISSTAAYVLLAVWGAGVLVYSTWQIICYRKFIHALKRTQTDVK